MEKEESCVLMGTGGIIVSVKMMWSLGWKRGELSCLQYVDESGGRLIVVKAGDILDSEEFKAAMPIVGREFPIGLNGYMQLDSGGRRQLGWESGLGLRQILNEGIKGIILQKVEESDGGD